MVAALSTVVENDKCRVGDLLIFFPRSYPCQLITNCLMGMIYPSKPLFKIKNHVIIGFLRALVSGNAILSHFTISKSYFINYTIPIYNTSNIPKFYFAILHIKLIFYIIFFFFSNFFLYLPSTSITIPPLPSHHHRTSNMPTTPPLPTAHQNPTTTKTHIKKKKKPRRKGRTQKNQLTMR